MEHGRKEIQSRKTRLHVHLLQKYEKVQEVQCSCITHVYDKQKNAPKILHGKTKNSSCGASLEYYMIIYDVCCHRQ